MHEMSVAQNIIEIVQQHLPENRDQTVKSVNLKVGKMAGIVPESLEMCFQIIAADTAGMAGASLKMQMVPLIILCKDCYIKSDIDDPFFICPVCGSGNVETISGMDLQVTEIEIEDPSQEVL